MPRFKPKRFDKEVPLRVDRETYDVLKELKDDRKLTIASLIREAIDDSLEDLSAIDATIECAGHINPNYKFATMFLTTEQQLNAIETVSDKFNLSRNTFIVAALRRFVDQGVAVAAVNTDRAFIGIELDPNYFQIAHNRIK